MKQASGGPVNVGKGFNRRANGRIVTHGKSVIPKWKQKRLGLYKYDVYQTIFLSKSNRLPNSANVLETFRYPIKAPECLDGERVQAMIFQPFCSHYSGTHSTLFRKIRPDGTDIDHSTTRLDVVQRKADLARHDLPVDVDGTQGGPIFYQGHTGAGDVTASDAYNAANIAQVHRYYDQLVKHIKVDLVFMASRAFPMKISVSVVRFIEPTAPYTLATDDKRMLLNNLNNKGMEYTRYKTEWLHEFTLPALRQNRKPPTYSINKELKCNFLQTNTFQQDNVADTMTQSGNTLLGKGIDIKKGEVADGFMSGSYLILIKYRKCQKPTQFTYSQVLDTTASGVATAQVELPMLSEESFDVVTNAGGGVPGDGSPARQDQGNETLGSFYVHGKIVNGWGFRKQPDAIPSLVSQVPANANFRKAQSLMIDPTNTADDTYGLYTQSGDHQQIPGDTSTTGP